MQTVHVNNVRMHTVHYTVHVWTFANASAQVGAHGNPESVGHLGNLCRYPMVPVVPGLGHC